MVEHHKTGSFDVLVQVFFQRFGAVNECTFSHGAVMKCFEFSFGALTYVLFCLVLLRN
jgi:hypothetical protein